MSEALVTFIIPTIGRRTISNTINSLFHQTSENWLAIIVIDGDNINITVDDERISIIKIKKTGEKNHAGNVRNQAFPLVKTEWIAFVDDDDCVTNDYIERLQEEISITPDCTTVLFRMYNANLITNILPEPNVINFEYCKVGISFAIKTEITQKYKFEPSHTEDYSYLNKLRLDKNKIVLSPYVTYLANSSDFDYKHSKNYNRAIIN